jgi:hypothetical protein
MKMLRPALYVASMSLAASFLAASQGVYAQTPNDTQHDEDHAAVSSGPLVDLVRRETQRYRNVENAVEDGYAPGPCVSGPEIGAMGIHYIKGSLIGDGVVDPATPEALIYEPQPNGALRFVGVEYITLAEFWPDPDRPTLAGHLLNFVGAPNRYGLPAFLEIHVWAWRRNPNGTFVDWNPNVSCDATPLPN